MTTEINIVSISCKAFVDCNDDSLSLNSVQKSIDHHVDGLFTIANKYIGHTNRIILTNTNYAEMAYAGSPEQAVLLASNILNEMVSVNKLGLTSVFGQIGIHLEPACKLSEFTNQANIIGNCMSRAQHLMKSAQRNQIVVSQSCYENIPQSAQALTTLFCDPIRERENSLQENKADLISLTVNHLTINQETENKPLLVNQPTLVSKLVVKPIAQQSRQKPKQKPSFSDFSYWAFALKGLLVLFGLLIITKVAMAPNEELQKTVKTFPIKPSRLANSNKPVDEIEPVMDNSYIDNTDADDMVENLEPKIFKETIMPKSVDLKKSIQQDNPNSKRVEIKEIATKELVSKKATTKEPSAKNLATEKPASKKPSKWEAFKNHITDGGKIECTQPQIAMNQCR